MSRPLALLATVALTAGALLVPSVAPAAEAAYAPTKYKNCTELNKKYPNGVGKKGAKDKVSGKTRPVTNFRVDTALYNAQPKTLDRDKDGIACERHTPATKKAPAKKTPAKKAAPKKAVATKRK